MIWLDALQANIKRGHAWVLVTVSAVEGSAPRQIGARMLVTADTISDTVGGGALEKKAIKHSRILLLNAQSTPIFESHTSVLGTELLQQLPCRAHFYDSRTEWLNKLPAASSMQGQIFANTLASNAFLAVEQCPDNAYFLVMTHNHELDFELIEAILSRGDSTYCGLIASSSKAASFRSRLARKGFTKSELLQLSSPIGAAYKTGNLPMEIAIATLSELLQRKYTLNPIGEDTKSPARLSPEQLK